jgi:hypothetical protein
MMSLNSIMIICISDSENEYTESRLKEEAFYTMYLWLVIA